MSPAPVTSLAHRATSRQPLLGPGDPDPVGILFADSPYQVLLIADHAGNAVPSALGDLGIPRAELDRHIGIDIGTRALGEAISARLGATFIHQRYSRLVIDCNRAPHQPSATPVISDGTRIPANEALTDRERDARTAEIFTPYQDAIGSVIEQRLAAGRAVLLVSLHSFTPRLLTSQDPGTRPWQVGVLHDGGDTRLSHAMLDVLRRDPSLTVGDNEPYRMDGTDHTVPRHAYPHRIPYLELEVRQDLLADAAGVDAWCDRLTDAITSAIDALS